MIKEKIINKLELFEVTSDSFPFRIIDEHELIVYVIQGLSLSTVSLVSTVKTC